MKNKTFIELAAMYQVTIEKLERLDANYEIEQILDLREDF